MGDKTFHYKENVPTCISKVTKSKDFNPSLRCPKHITQSRSPSRPDRARMKDELWRGICGESEGCNSIHSFTLSLQRFRDVRTEGVSQYIVHCRQFMHPRGLEEMHNVEYLLHWLLFRSVWGMFSVGLSCFLVPSTVCSARLTPNITGLSSVDERVCSGLMLPPEQTLAWSRAAKANIRGVADFIMNVLRFWVFDSGDDIVGLCVWRGWERAKGRLTINSALPLYTCGTWSRYDFLAG